MPHRAPLPPHVYEHVTQKEWGRAVLLHETVDRRTFGFEDGTERSFRQDFWDRMKEVDVPHDEAQRVERASRRSAPSTSRAKPKAAPAKPSITFAEQLERFLAAFPVGFDDVTYLRAERGEPGAPAAARLKDAGVRHAQERLGADSLRARLRAGDFEGVVREAHEALTFTRNTVTKAAASPLRALEAGRAEKVAAALVSLLHEEGPRAPRFDAFVASVGAPGTLSWPAATLLPALVHPDRELFVKPSAFEKQALVLGMEVRHGASPDGATYAQLLDAAEEVRRRLRKAGQAPRDLLDVHAFVVRTLGAKAPRTLGAKAPRTTEE